MEDEQQQATACTDPREAWKAFGGDTEAGRLLKKLYHGNAKPIINYPKPKVKKREQLDPFIPAGGTGNDSRTNQLSAKASDRAIKAPSFTKGNSVELHPIDYAVAKRKPYSEIEKEINQIKRHFESYRLTTVNKKPNQEKEKLQQVFSYTKGSILPRELLPGPELLDKELAHDHVKRNGNVPRNRVEQLEEIYDQVLGEIESRKSFINDMISLGKPEKAETIQKEILDRLSELKRIDGLIQKERQNANNHT